MQYWPLRHLLLTKGAYYEEFEYLNSCFFRAAAFADYSSIFHSGFPESGKIRFWILSRCKMRISFATTLLKKINCILSGPKNSQTQVHDNRKINYNRKEQCEQIGQYLKALGNKFSYKSSPNIRCRFGYFENFHF